MESFKHDPRIKLLAEKSWMIQKGAVIDIAAEFLTAWIWPFSL